ncbi:HAMP domain-containing sensor histidine kinase [soil metagenome]
MSGGGRSVSLNLNRTSLAAVLAVVSLAALAAGLIVVDQAGERIIAARQRLVAETARDYFVAFASEDGLLPLAKALDRREKVAEGAFRYAVFDNDGRLLGGSDLYPGESLPQPGFSVVDIERNGKQRPYEVLVQPMAVGGMLAIYEDLGDRMAFRWAIIAAAAASLLTGLALITVASLWLWNVLLTRAQGVALAAERIADGDLSARAPVGDRGDVFDHLGVAVNTMLSRIEELLTGLRTVTDSLAHDLRSPLTRLRGALTRALDPTASESARMDAVEQAHGEAEQVLATFSALLDIVRAEAGLSRETMAPVELRTLIADLAELFAPTVEDMGQVLTPAAPGASLVIMGHEILLRQALGNLLHNASRYAGPGARIALEVSETPTSVRLTVADNGPGVPLSQRGRVQERFVRLDDSRSTPGSGLGLAIAAACAKLHAGRLLLEDNDPGLRCVLEISRG